MNYGFLKILLIILGSIAILGSAFKILREYERAVVFRLGRMLSAKGPGLIFLIPLIDRIRKIDMRIVSIDVPRQDIMTRDNVPVTVDAVVYFNITDPALAVITIKDIYQSTFLIAQATLRNVLGQIELDDLLSQQSKINQELEKIISVHTKQWGIKISIVEIKEVTLPEMMKRAMAKQAETERERRARLIDAQAEYQASKTLSEAGKILSDNPQSLQLRYLQTLRDISTNKGSTILFPLPIDLLAPFMDGVKKVFHSDRNIKSQELTEKLMESEELMKLEKLIKKEGPKNGGEVKEKVLPAGEPNIIKGPVTQYKSDLHKGKLQPQYVQWAITNRCQFQCSHCETAAGQNNNHELTTSQAKELVDDLAEMNCEFLSITGGEPMLRNDLFDIIQYAKTKGLKVGFTTNGQATEENLPALSEAKFDSVVVTIDAYGESQNRIRNSHDSYERGIQTIKFFHDKGIPRICMSTVLLDDNINEFPRLTEDVFRAGANLMQIQPRIFQDGRPLRNSPEIVKDAFRFILEARRRRFPVEAGEQFGYLGPLEPLLRSNTFFCGSGWNTFCVNANGMIQGCPAPTIPGITEGNCLEDSIKNIWLNKFQSFRKEMPDDLENGCHKCSHLSLCRGGCWLFRAQGLNPCFLPEAEQVYREISNVAMYPQTH
ncbi:MAG: SPFH domain-containing protein [bacterium]